MAQEARVLIDCADVKGLVYHISRVFYERSLNIDTNREFVDKQTGRFFMRTVISGNFEVDELHRALETSLPRDAVIRIIEPKPKRVVLMATKESHCLGDILIRWESGEFGAKIVAVFSNHNLLRGLTERFDIPFVHLPTEGLTRAEHEAMALESLGEIIFDYIVLAKYMRIFSGDFVARYPRRIVNIHHSFLPAFVGANPYKQAYERGVKIIGATAHFVTDDLDEGPIIAQDVIPVNHRMEWQEMQRAGRDVEKVVLARALSYVLDDRVFVYGNKTIIF
jgi:formyltetrahydrofolate deformylase